MGASWWQYVVPYEPDTSAAFERLRWEVFRSGAYYREPPRPGDDLAESEFIASLGGMDDDPDGPKQFLLDEWRARHNRGPARDPLALLAAQPESGTHSPIDLYLGVSEQPQPFTTSPLTDEQLVHAFGSTTPTRADLDAWLDRTTDHVRHTWSGFHVVLYEEGRPAEIFFAAYSGD